MAKKITREEKQDILNMLGHGMTNWEIMEKTGRCHETICKISREYKMHDMRFNFHDNRFTTAMGFKPKKNIDNTKAIDTIYAIIMGV